MTTALTDVAQLEHRPVPAGGLQVSISPSEHIPRVRLQSPVQVH